MRDKPVLLDYASLGRQRTIESTGWMDIHEITQAIRQEGLPIPAVPTLLVVGSLVAGIGETGLVIVAMVLASVLADWIWYLSGRAFGYRVLSGLCKLSINPASCVTKTEDRFLRWGLWSLVVAKFIPGFSTVAPPIAGALRMSLSGFLTAAAAGALLWGGSAITVGWLFRTELQTLLAGLDQHGGRVALLILGGLALWLAWKLWQKYRFQTLSAIPHITPAELAQAMASENPPLILDLRGTSGTGRYRCRSWRRAGRTRQSSGGGRLPAEIG